MVLASLLSFGLSASVVSAYYCTSFDVPITISASSYTPAFPPFESHYDAVAFLNAIVARNGTKAPSPFSGVQNITETVNISAQYCVPAEARHESKLDVQILSHGLGFDRSYWDFGGSDSEYNYIKIATAVGYATLSYDRLGNGASSIVDPYSRQQAPIELAVLTALTQRLRNGTLQPLIPEITGKVFHVGHSYGSALSNALAAAAPSLSDGLILTGYSHELSFNPEFLINTGFHLAKENQPARFGNRSTGSLTWGDELANQLNFLAWPFFDPAVLKVAEATKYPFSLGEILTGSINSFNATAFTGPVLVISGDADLIFCGSDCTGGLLEKSRAFFPASKKFETYVQPHTGHGMNLHFNATGMYEVVQSFLKTIA